MTKHATQCCKFVLQNLKIFNIIDSLGDYNMKIAISTESTCDLSQEMLDKRNIHTLAYTVILGDDMVTDNADLPARIFKYVEETKE